METPIALAKRAYEAFGRGDIPGVLELIADDVDWKVVGPSSLPYPTHCKSKAEVGAYFQQLAASDEITRFEPREFIEAGERLVVLGWVEANIRSNNEPFESEWVHVMTIKDGLLRNWTQFFDTAARVR
ncbi:nuclear transport factor 2 family protein [Paraburkholderia dilworthii]|uniref:nuclear transport factor 2 family protein n=1 Tax=Paraburkholderia dilworthii TaxID=948106 RepID=UPI00041173CF|nr:nuclear transport factor 2 family protein [Paraburkholderia dilworthii]